MTKRIDNLTEQQEKIDESNHLTDAFIILGPSSNDNTKGPVANILGVYPTAMLYFVNSINLVFYSNINSLTFASQKDLKRSAQIL